MAHMIGHFIAGLVMTEWHLCLNLIYAWEKEKVQLSFDNFLLA